MTRLQRRLRELSGDSAGYAEGWATGEFPLNGRQCIVWTWWHLLAVAVIVGLLAPFVGWR